VQVSYEPDPDFTGKDNVTIEFTYPDGSKNRRKYTFNINIVEINRVMVADQSLVVAFLYALNPDCTVIGAPTVRVVEQPKSGKLEVANGTGFPNFPAANVRSKCNASRTDG